ncbi:MAG: serine/threonine-protein kinase [bacterium]
MAIQMGDKIAEKYRVQRLLGRGGMGSVYLGVQEPLGRPVAIKTLTTDELTAEERAYRETRFFREAAICAQLSHPNTVIVYDYGELADKELFLVMEYLEGKSLRQLEKERGRLAPDISIHIASQIAASLADAHDHGIIHRDLKPPNIMLVERGNNPYFVKVVDFGLVKDLHSSNNEPELTREDSIVGSPMYMAPERFLSKEFDAPAVDIYALGVMLYEMLTGRPPFELKAGTTIHQLVLDHVEKPPPSFAEVAPDLVLPRGLERLVMLCLEKVPTRRPGSMASIQHHLAEIANAQSVPVEKAVHTSAAPSAFEVADDTVPEPEPEPDPPVVVDAPERRPPPPRLLAALGAIAVLSAVVVGVLFWASQPGPGEVATLQPKTDAPPPKTVVTKSDPAPTEAIPAPVEHRPEAVTLSDVVDTFTGLRRNVLCKLGESLTLKNTRSLGAVDASIVAATSGGIAQPSRAECLAVGVTDVRTDSSTLKFYVGIEDADLTVTADCPKGGLVRGRVLFTPAGAVKEVMVWTPTDERADCVVASIRKKSLPAAAHPRIADFEVEP